MKQSNLNITSRVENVNGTPRLFINNQMFEGDSYITYYSFNNDYAGFSKIGFNIYSVCIYFAARCINETSKIPPLSKGIFDSKEGMKLVDIEVNKVLAVNPNALIFFRVDTSLPESWDKKHKKEMNSKGFNDGNPRPCLSSELYKKEVQKCLKKLVTHIVHSPYAEHIFGYQIAGGMTQEWLAFDIDANEGFRSREKYILKKKKDPDKYPLDYIKFRNEENAGFLCDLAKYVKKITEHRLVVGSFYGYTLCVVYACYGHLALDKVLSCKDIDFLCSPIGYYTNRSVFEDNPLMIPLASLTLHNKLFFAENDTRTDLTKPGNDLPHYNTEIWFGPERKFSLEICKMHFASSLCKGHTYWWFDMWGKWYEHEDFYSLFKQMKEISHEALNKDQTSVSEIAVIYSSDSIILANDFATTTKVNRDIFALIGRSGLVYDAYSIKDFKKIKRSYKLFIILWPVMSSDLKSLIKTLKANNQNYFIYDNNSSISTSDLRNIAKDAKINIFFNEDIVHYENSSYLFLHAVNDGIINLPEGYKLKPLLNAPSFPIQAEKGKGYLFEKIK